MHQKPLANVFIVVCEPKRQRIFLAVHSPFTQVVVQPYCWGLFSWLHTLSYRLLTPTKNANRPYWNQRRYSSYLCLSVMTDNQLLSHPSRKGRICPLSPAQLCTVCSVVFCITNSSHHLPKQDLICFFVVDRIRFHRGLFYH